MKGNYLHKLTGVTVKQMNEAVPIDAASTCGNADLHIPLAQVTKRFNTVRDTLIETKFNFFFYILQAT